MILREGFRSEPPTTIVWSVLKPSFNAFVFFDGHLYGFDQNILVCVDAATGKRLWKKGRYGFGRMILLENVGQLIVLSEFGEWYFRYCQRYGRADHSER